MNTIIIDSSQINDLSPMLVENWRNNAHWLLIPFAEVVPDYLNEISSNIDTWAQDSQALVIDASRFFEELPWKPPAIAQKHLPLVLGMNLSKWKTAKLREVLPKLSSAELSSWPALHLDYEEAYDLLYKYSTYYYQAGVLVTDFCNLRCEMCMFHSANESEYEFRKLRRPDRLQQEVPRESVITFIDQLLPGASVLFSSSGELMMSKRAVEYIEYTSQQGKSPLVITNGMLLTPEISARLLAAGVSHFIISVDGHTETIYQKRRKGGILATVLKNIKHLRLLIEQQKLPVTIDINTIMFAELENQKKEILDFWREKVDQLTFLAERMDYLGKPRKPFLETAPVRLCLEPMTGPLLLSNGLIAPCCSVAIAEWFEPMEWLLHIKETSLDQASKTYRLMMLDEESPLRKYCSRCHYWSNSFWRNGKSPFSEIYNFRKPQGIFKKLKSLAGLWE
jgi:sulfatase maturation enzyme AslB (radical SAM superfamily)